MRDTIASDHHRAVTKSLILAHLHRLHTIDSCEQVSPGDISGQYIPMGFDGVSFSREHGLFIDQHRCTPTPRRLSGIMGEGSDAYRYFPDTDLLLAARRGGYDPVLYDAYRDIFPPRHKRSAGLTADGGGSDGEEPARGYWYADLVVYHPGTLPNGEPFRSTGHWNLPGQLEAFETLAGRVLMIMGGYAEGGEPYLLYQACQPGHIVVMPFRGWHLTYVLDGPAVVFNVSTESAAESCSNPGRQASLAGKYRRAEPLAIAMQKLGESYRFVGADDALQEWGRPDPAPRAHWLNEHVRAGESLADFYLYGSAERLALFIDAAWTAYRTI